VSAEESRTAVVRDIELAKRYRIDSTPSFLINGKLVKGALTFAEFQTLIERELQQTSTN
jgi:protein-disulfide isomerase